MYGSLNKDDIYTTPEEIAKQNPDSDIIADLTGVVSKSGDTMSGALNFSSNSGEIKFIHDTGTTTQTSALTFSLRFEYTTRQTIFYTGYGSRPRTRAHNG